MKKFFTKKNLKDFLIINIGVFLMSFAYTILIDRNKLVIGGVGGLATVLCDVINNNHLFGNFTLSSSIVILAINTLLLIFALLFVGKSFFIKTIYTSLIYPIYVFIFEQILRLLNDKIPNLAEIFQVVESNGFDKNVTNALMSGSYLLFVIFGAVISGLGLGLALKKGASTGGVDIIQQFLLNTCKVPFSVSLFIVDGSIVLLGTILYGNFFMLLYGFVFIYLSGVVLDAVAFSGFTSRAVHIITNDPEAIKKKIYDTIGRGVTEVYSRGGYNLLDRKVLICVMSNKEFYKMKSIILELDPRAFIYVERASEVHGEGFSYDSPDEVVINE